MTRQFEASVGDEGAKEALERAQGPGLIRVLDRQTQDPELVFQMPDFWTIVPSWSPGQPLVRLERIGRGTKEAIGLSVEVLYLVDGPMLVSVDPDGD